MNYLLKSFLLVVIIFFSFNQHTQAQSFQLGAQAGGHINGVLIYGQNQVPAQATFGAQAGAFVRNNFTEVIGLQTGLLYSFQRISANDPNNQALNNLQMHYLKLPLLFNLTLAKIVRLGVGVEAGLLLNNNSGNVALQGLSLGGRLELALKLGQSFELFAYSNYDLSPITETFQTNDDGIQIAQNSYHSAFAGLGISIAFLNL